MNINELNTKLVSELRQIAKLIGIPEVEKLRKQELIDKIAASEQQGTEVNTETPIPQKEVPNTSVKELAPEPDKTRRRTRTSNANEPVAVTREAEPEFEQPKPSVPSNNNNSNKTIQDKKEVTTKDTASPRT
jgi:transcription termination factor Rho